MKTLIGFFSSMAQVRSAMEHLSSQKFGSPTMTALSESAQTAHPINVQRPASPGEDGLPANTADIAAASAGRIPLPAILDPTTSHELNGSLKDEPSARPIADPGVASIPGGLSGALKGWGFSGQAAHDCEQQIREGHALLVVELISDDMTFDIQNILTQEGADHILDSGHLKV